MKRMLLMGICMFCLGISAAPAVSAAESGDVAIDAEAFPDDFFREHVRKYVDTNQDGVLQSDEAAAVTKMTLDKFLDLDDQEDEDEPKELHYYTEDEYTFDCKGLELFENLSDLSLYLNDGLTENDEKYVTKISNMDCLYEMKNLEKLHIYNIDVKKFDCAKFSHLRKLELYCFPNMKSISFGKSKILTDVWLSEMPALDTVNVSTLSNLKNLRLTNADVEKIQFGKKNRSIKTLTLESGATKKYCLNMRELDLSRLTGLKNLCICNYKNLKFPDLSHNKKLKELFVEKCRKFTKIAPLKNKNLTNVDVWDCKNLNTLDLSKNAKLSWLRIDGMKIMTIRLNANNKLEYFRYSRAGLKKLDVKNINKKTLKSIQLWGNKLKKVDLSKYTNLIEVDVDKGVEIIGWEPDEDKPKVE